MRRLTLCSPPNWVFASTPRKALLRPTLTRLHGPHPPLRHPPAPKPITKSEFTLVYDTCTGDLSAPSGRRRDAASFVRAVQEHVRRAGTLEMPTHAPSDNSPCSSFVMRPTKSTRPHNNVPPMIASNARSAHIIMHPLPLREAPL